jgi:MFS family permease
VHRPASPTYRALFAVSGFRRLGAATVVARTGATMQSLVLVLFVLQRFHSPPLAGLVVFLSLVPGILISPVAGALLDRHRRMLLINLDYAIAAISLSAIAGLDAIGRLPVAALLLIVSVSSLTNPLSNSGTRSLFPIMVPRPLWERANAVDSGAYVVAAIAGPAVAGLLIGIVGAQAALLATAGLYVVGLVLLLGMAEPLLERMETASLAGDALAGLTYVVRHRELRGLAVATAVSNIAFGIISVGMPVLLLSHLHVGDGSVGLMYAVMGVAGLLSGTIAGRMDSEHREVWFVLVGCVVSAFSMLTMLLAAGIGGGLVVVGLAMALFGIANGPFDIGLFSLRQRVTAPAWMGRAFAVSMSLNFIGMPIGSAIGGPIVEHSIPAAFAVAVLVDVIAGVSAVLMLRPQESAEDGKGGGSLGDGPSRRGRTSPLAAE